MNGECYRNYLNINNYDEPIYRIVSIERFIEIIKKNKNTLVKPQKWDDPFENFLLNSHFLLDKEVVQFSARDSIYGQCWTQHRETDAMWRIYSKNKDGVRLETTPRKLLDSLKVEIGDSSLVRCFIGKVNYIQAEEFSDCYKKIFLMDSSGAGIAESLLYKRIEFKHENEVRLIYHGQDGECKSDLFGYDIDCKIFFNSIMFDPRMSDSLKEFYEESLKSIGFEFNFIKSTLYDFPKKTVEFKLP